MLFGSVDPGASSPGCPEQDREVGPLGRTHSSTWPCNGERRITAPVLLVSEVSGKVTHVREHEKKLVRELRAAELGETVLAVALWGLFFWWVFG